MACFIEHASAPSALCPHSPSALCPLPSALVALRQQLAALQPPPRAGAAVVPTGIAALDGLLADGGVPCGRLTEILGRRGSGRTTLVRQLVAAAIGARRWVAVVDGSRTLAPREWAAVGDSGRLWVIRPPDPDRGAWCADILLRSGAFSLVVLDGTSPLTRPVAVRLTRLAQEHDVALVVAAEEGGVVGSAVRIRTTRSQATGRRSQVNAIEEQRSTRPPRAPGPRPPLFESRPPSPVSHPAESRITLLVEKGGSHHPVEVCCAIPMARRLCAHPEVPDRRGVAKRNRQGQRVASPHRRTTAGTAGNGQRAAETADHGEHETERHSSGHRPEAHPSFVGGTLPNKRRCAEPAIKRDEFLLAR